MERRGRPEAAAEIWKWREPQADAVGESPQRARALGSLQALGTAALGALLFLYWSRIIGTVVLTLAAVVFASALVSPTGLFWAERNFNRAWEQLRRRFGKKARPLNWHSTRHTFITWALEAGHSPKRVSQWVGASTTVIHSRYEHAVPDQGENMDFSNFFRATRTVRGEG